MGGRHRAFNAVFYPESAPENWREIVDSWHVPALAILHDRDVDQNGDPKKEHLHLLLMFSGVKTLNQVHEMTDQLGSKTVEPSRDLRASARYLLHLDHPEKFQYPFTALESFSGAPAVDLTACVGDPSPEIMAFVREQGIVEYSALIDYCLDQRLEWFPWARSHTQYLTGYLNSARHKNGGRE